ncbi:MAG: hypothetical protein CM15mP41_2180 [Flammeovirgaceae bacterium]|nr:MAG: hypothetical protein CM15mP41_2180 [Flammeovirgaceae bacterium]
MKITMPKERPSDKIKLDVDLLKRMNLQLSNYVIFLTIISFFPNDYKKFILRQSVLIVINHQCG